MTHEELTAWREVRGWDIRTLAERLGVQFSTVWRWETGKRAIPPYLVYALQCLPTTPGGANGTQD